MISSAVAVAFARVPYHRILISLGFLVAEFLDRSFRTAVHGID